MTFEPFGMALQDHLEGKSPTITIERDDGYIDEMDFEEYFVGYDGFPACEKQALAYAKGRTLDLGLGAGRVCLHLQDQGLDPVGIDISDLALEVARKRGVRNAVNMSVCELEFEEGSFDTVVAFGNNFGLCGAPEKVLGMMVRLRGILREDGAFLAESVNPVATDNPAHLRYHKANLEKGKYRGHVRIRDKYKGVVGGWFDLLMVTPDEMTELAKRAGFRVERICRESESDRLYVAVLKKA
jgi:SAM-dependent methyltransferase